MSRRGASHHRLGSAIGLLCLQLAACGPLAETGDLAGCTEQSVPVSSGLGSTGKARVFDPDPIVASGNANLLPLAAELNSYASSVSLQNLLGKGTLDGAYVSVRTGKVCGRGFGAYSESQDFSFVYGDSKFQEANAYYAGDRYRAHLAFTGNLLPASPVPVVVHCMEEDNAYYVRVNEVSGVPSGRVCLGDSVSTPGASYADDSTVVVHELQHGATGDAYSLATDLNRYWYDEAGALNEAISDFMALGFYAPLTSAALDPRFFSRWALNTFSSYSYLRGAHKCPEYSAGFPECSGYSAGPSGFDSSTGKVSYSYPDGMGWPFARNYSGASVMRTLFQSFGSQQEIHNAATVATGVLWDVYQGIQAANGGNAATAYATTTKLIHTAMKLVPQPSQSLWSPVTLPAFANALRSAATQLAIPGSESSALDVALTARGLLGAPVVPGAWASVGPGRSVGGSIPADGVYIQDEPAVLKSWLGEIGVDASVVSQESGDNKLQAGEVAAIWFDVQNDSPVTAGGVNITLTALHSGITFLRYPYNMGAVNSAKTQIQYHKINGSSIVTNLSKGASPVPTGNTYFLTDPFFAANYTTAVWIRVAPGASGSKTIQAEIKPSNGTTVTVDFVLNIQ